MLLGKALSVCAVAFGVSVCSGCAVPRYDVPRDSAGQPTAETIVDRIQCELRDMVRDDMGENDVTSFHRLFLLNGDYDVEVSLSLQVNNTGGLAPSLAYINPLSIAATSFVFSGNGTLSESRDHNFTENIQLSTRAIYADWKTNSNPHNCPTPDTHLSGKLGLSDFVAMAAVTQNLDETQKLSGGGAFGGSIQFLVTKNINALGPTWTLVHFAGPGPLASLSKINTDKITVAFAQGPNAGKPMNLPTALKHQRRLNVTSYAFLQQLLTSSINSQLTQVITQQNSVLNRVPSLITLQPGVGVR
jgi:hypothetical protein